VKRGDDQPHGNQSSGSATAPAVALSLTHVQANQNNLAQFVELRKHCQFDIHLVGGLSSDIPDGVVTVEDFYGKPGHMPASVKVLKMVSHGLVDHTFLPSTITDLQLSFGGVVCDIVVALPRGIFTNSLKALDLLTLSHVKFASGVLPASLTFLRMTSWSLCNLGAGSIPESVTTLFIDYYENGIVKSGVIPPSITTLDVDLELFRQISRQLSRLTHLSLSSTRAAVPGDIPNTVTHLVCHGTPPPNVIPNSVTHLHVVDTFPFDLLRKGVVPSSVTHLNVWIRHLP
jgi:hypothetical protein